jgi:transposase InsO family protein
MGYFRGTEVSGKRCVATELSPVFHPAMRRVATALGLKLCFTPFRSPDSNGIAEAFVKTFKRDYALLSILPDADTVIALLPAWFEDYNEVHPHSGLKFLSPREFLRLLSGQTGCTPPCAIEMAVAS